MARPGRSRPSRPISKSVTSTELLGIKDNIEPEVFNIIYYQFHNTIKYLFEVLHDKCWKYSHLHPFGNAWLMLQAR